MQPTNLGEYVAFRRGAFISQSEMAKGSFAPAPDDVLKVASTMGRPEDLKAHRTGTLHSTFTYRAGSDQYLLRVFNHPNLPAYHMHLEEWAASAAQEGLFPSVLPFVTDTSRYLAPFDYQILPYLGPRTARNLDPLDLKETLAQVAMLLPRVHAVMLKGYGPLDPRPLFNCAPLAPRGLFDTWEDYLRVGLDDHLDTCVSIGAITPAERASIVRIFSEYPETFAFQPGLVHGDLSSGNILVDQGLRVIDWENAIAGDPVFDLAAWSASHMPVKPARPGASRFPGIVDPYYEAESKPYDFDLRFWIYYLRIVLARTVHRHRFGVADDPVFPPPARRIQVALEELV